MSLCADFLFAEAVFKRLVVEGRFRKVKHYAAARRARSYRFAACGKIVFSADCGAFQLYRIVVFAAEHTRGYVAVFRIEHGKVARRVAQPYVALLYAAFRLFAEGFVYFNPAALCKRVGKVFNRYALGRDVQLVCLYVKVFKNKNKRTLLSLQKSLVLVILW